MTLSLLPIIPTKNINEIISDIDYNFNQLVANGGGIQGVQGLQGVAGVGAVGQTGASGADGTRGSIWSISSSNPTASPSNLEGDNHLNISDSSIWMYDGISWVNQGTLSNSILSKNPSFFSIYNTSNDDFLWLTDNNTISPPSIYGSKLKITTQNVPHIRLSYYDGSVEYENKSATLSVIDTDGTLYLQSMYKTKLMQADDLELQGISGKYSRFTGFDGVNIDSVLNVGNITSTVDATNFSINSEKGIKLRNVLSFNNGTDIARIHFQNYNGLTSTVGSYIESRLTATNNGYLRLVGNYSSPSYIRINPEYNILGGYYQLLAPDNDGSSIEQGIKYQGYGISGLFQKYSDFSIEALSRSAGSNYEASSLILRAGSILSSSISGSSVSADGDGGSIFLEPGNGLTEGNVILNLERITNSAIGRTLIGTASSAGLSYRLQVNGDAYKNTGGNWTSPSDGRLKENVEYLSNEDTLSLIRGMKPVKFNYIREKEINYFGFIAQDFEKVIPEMVKTNEDGYLSMSYGNLDAIIIASIKALDEKIKEIESKLQ